MLPREATSVTAGSNSWPASASAVIWWTGGVALEHIDGGVEFVGTITGLTAYATGGS